MRIFALGGPKSTESTEHCNLHDFGPSGPQTLLSNIANYAKMALSEKMKEGTVTIIDKLSVKDISTKKLNKIVNDLDLVYLLVLILLTLKIDNIVLQIVKTVGDHQVQNQVLAN